MTTLEISNVPSLSQAPVPTSTQAVVNRTCGNCEYLATYRYLYDDAYNGPGPVAKRECDNDDNIKPKTVKGVFWDTIKLVKRQVSCLGDSCDKWVLKKR